MASLLPLARSCSSAEGAVAKYNGRLKRRGSAKQVDEWLLQATFILGAHLAHPF